MKHFHILAHGKDFDVDRFLASSNLKPDLVWRRGDLKSGGFPNDPFVTSGVKFELGEGKEILYPEQADVAISFLKSHRDELKALGEFPGVDHFFVMFHYERDFYGEMTGGCVGASQRLMWHALDVGCRLTFTFVLHCATYRQIETIDDDEAE